LLHDADAENRVVGTAESGFAECVESCGG